LFFFCFFDTRNNWLRTPGQALSTQIKSLVGSCWSHSTWWLN
jgi:hypothetical protein